MEICIAKYTPTGRIEPTSPYHSSLMLYLLRHRLLCKGLFLFFDLLSPEFVLGKTTFRSEKMNSKCGRPEISKISPKTHVLRFSKVISDKVTTIHWCRRRFYETFLRIRDGTLNIRLIKQRSPKED